MEIKYPKIKTQMMHPAQYFSSTIHKNPIANAKIKDSKISFHEFSKSLIDCVIHCGCKTFSNIV